MLPPKEAGDNFFFFFSFLFFFFLTLAKLIPSGLNDLLYILYDYLQNFTDILQ